jgi:hypothetical protein
MDEQAKQGFYQECKTYLSGRSLDELRTYGRMIGVFRPTDKKKEDLIEQICGILVGDVAPIIQNGRGAPIKNKHLDPSISVNVENLLAKYSNNTNTSTKSYSNPYDGLDIHKFKHENRKTLKCCDSQAARIEEVDGRRKVYVGQLQAIDGIYRLLPLNCIDNSLPQIIPEALVQEYDIREGDKVTFFGEKGENFKENFIKLRNFFYVSKLSRRRKSIKLFKQTKPSLTS